MFAAVVSSLGACMAVRYTAYAQNLWRVAANAFNSVVAAGLPAVNIACVQQVRPVQLHLATLICPNRISVVFSNGPNNRKTIQIEGSGCRIVVMPCQSVSSLCDRLLAAKGYPALRDERHGNITGPC